MIQRNETFLEFLGSGQGASESELDAWLPHPAEFGYMDGSDQTKRPLWRRGQEKSHRKTEGEDSQESREDGV